MSDNYVESIERKKFNSTSIDISQDGTVTMTFVDGYTLEIAEVRSIVLNFLANNQQIINKKFILDFRNIYGVMSPEARNYLAQDDLFHEMVYKIAILANNVPSKLIANFFIQYNRPKSPTKLFLKKEDACDWLAE